jgi:hypothetical protein
MMAKTLVITVHGINSDGKWQEQVEYALHPFFEFAHIKYDDYKFRGEVKLLLGPVAVSAFAGATLMLLWLFFSMHVFQAQLLLFPLVVLALGYPEAVLRRHRRVDWFKREIELRSRRGLEPFRAPGRTPHIIGHSLGTFLIGTTLRRFSDVRFNRVILSGCVLPCGFDWHGLHLRNQAFISIRNEVGKKDLVVKLAGLARLAVWGLGNAGVRGFYGYEKAHQGKVLELSERREFVHSVDNAYGPCAECRPSEDYSGVHNVHIEEANHKTPFVGNGHITTFWLPFLWGIEPRTYLDFRNRCSVAAELPPGRKLSVLESELGDLNLPWAGQTLRERVRHCIDVRIDPEDRTEDQTVENVESLVDRSVRLVWRIVTSAEKGEGAPELLNPESAIAAAVEATVEAEAHHGVRREDSTR